jgi:hypothetical protein
MPNQVTSHNDRTMLRALQALMGDNKISMDEAMDALDRLANAGLLIREPAEKEDKAPKDVQDKIVSG